MSSLFVIIPDHISQIVAKGEMIARYYNPGDLFDELHMISPDGDLVDPEDLRLMAGSARVHLHRLPPAGRNLFLRTLAWRPALLRSWARPVVELARQFRPALIRCYGAHLNAFAASCIKWELGVPYIVSLHTQPDQNSQMFATAAERLQAALLETAIRVGLRSADEVVPVYEAIGSYLRRMGRPNYRVLYNVINPANLRQKADYGLHQPVRLISVGRQMPGKNPENIIRAVAMLPGVHLTLIGSGPLHEDLKALAAGSGAEDRIAFHRSVPNDEICRILPDHDLYVVHSDFWGISKATLEPLLTGMPVIHNRLPAGLVPELDPRYVELVENTAEGYRSAISRLMADDAAREALGRAAYDHAREHWAPDRTEARFVALYREVMARAGTGGDLR